MLSFPRFQFHHPHSVCQELALSTRLIPSGRTSVRPAELPALLSPSSNPFSTTRQASFFLPSASLSSRIQFTFHLYISFSFAASGRGCELCRTLSKSVPFDVISV